MKQFLSAVWRLFISRRFAIGLLIILAALLFLGILLPTLSYHEPEEMALFEERRPILFQLGSTFNPPTLASSWTFLILTGLLMASTVACSIERIRNRGFRDPYGPDPTYFRKRKTFASPESPERVSDEAISILARGRWRLRTVTKAGVTGVSGRKGAVGFWGSIVFHLGFLVILLGVVISASTRLNGTILITETQSLPLNEQAFVQFARRPQTLQLPDTVLTLSRLEAVYVGGEHPIDYTSWLTFSDPFGGRQDKAAKVNKSVRYGELNFLLENYGYAPAVVAKDSSGKVLLDAFINLKGRDPNTEDSFDIPKTGVTVKTRFFPDYIVPKEGQINTRSLLPNNPAYLIDAQKAGETVYRGILARGETAKIDGVDLTFKELRRWSYLRVTADRGIAVIFWGFVVATAGLIFRFLLHERTISVTIAPGEAGSKVMVRGKSRYFPALFAQEIDRLSDKLARGKGQ